MFRKYLFCLFVVFFLSACRENLIHVSSELEANKVMLGLRVEGIDARKFLVAKEWVVDVPQAKLTDALKILDEKRVLRDVSESELEKNGSDIFSSRQEKEARVSKVVAANLSGTLRLLPEVIDARVHIFHSVTDAFAPSGAKDRTASVLLIARDTERVNLDDVKELVSQGGGVALSRVSVVLVSGGGFDSKKETGLLPAEHVNAYEEMSQDMFRRVNNSSSIELFGLFSIILGLFLLIGLFLLRFKNKKSGFFKSKNKDDLNSIIQDLAHG